MLEEVLVSDEQLHELLLENIEEDVEIIIGEDFENFPPLDEDVIKQIPTVNELTEHSWLVEVAQQSASRRALKKFIGQGRFSEARAQFLFFQIGSEKLRACVAILDFRGFKV